MDPLLADGAVMLQRGAAAALLADNSLWVDLPADWRDCIRDPLSRAILDEIEGSEVRGEGGNFVTVVASLGAKNRLVDLGGSGAVAECATGFRLPSAHFQHGFALLREAARKARLAQVGERLMRAARNGDAAALESAVKEGQEALSMSARGLPGVHAGEEAFQPQVMPPEIIEGLLHAGSKMMIGGTSKSYKTWILADLAVAVATGREWMGFQCRSAPVLMVNLEVGAPFFWRRLRLIAEDMGVRDFGGRLRVWNLKGYADDLMRIAPQIEREVFRGGHKIVIIDPIYKVLGDRDENSAGDIAQLMNRIDAMQVRTGSAVVFAAHFAKGQTASKTSFDRVSGSGVFARDPESIVTLTPHEEEETFVVDCTLRNHAPVSPFCVRMVLPRMVRDETADPEMERKPGKRAVGRSADDLVALLNGRALTTAQWESEAKEKSKIGRSSFYKAKELACRQGLVEKIRGVWVEVGGSFD